MRILNEEEKQKLEKLVKSSLMDIKLPRVNLETGKYYGNPPEDFPRVPDILLGQMLKIYLSYPLSVIVEMDLDVKTNDPMDLITQIIKVYTKIYKDEPKPEPKNPGDPLPCNRPKTNGKFGIWGHVLGDLVIHTIHIYTDGTGTLGIDS